MSVKKILPIIGIIVLIYILYTLDFQEIVAIFSDINPLYSFLCFFAIVPLILLANIEWQLILKKQKIHVSFFYSIKNFFIGYFYGFITPGAFGAYTRAMYLSHESKTPVPKCVSNIIILNTLDYIALLLLGAIGAVYLSSVFPNLFLIILAIIVILVTLLLFFLKKRKSKIVFTKIIQLKMFATMKDRLENSIDSFFEDLPRFRDVLLPFGISLFGWIIKYIELYFISRLFSIEVPFIYFILILAVGDVIASAPISIYGIGTREAALIPLFSMFSLTFITNEQIVSLSLFWFVIIWLSPSIIGAFVTVSETKKLNKSLLKGSTAERFTKYMKKYPKLYENLAGIVKKNTPKTVKKPCIVDLGCGPGLLSSEISKKIPKAKIVGIDLSVKMLEIANKNVEKENFKTMIGSSENIPLEDNSADIVVSRFSLTYWGNPKESFKEINRVLKPGGRVILECLNKDFTRWRLFLIKIHMFLRSAGSDVARYHVDAYKIAYTIGSVKKLFSDAGFKIIYEKDVEKDWEFTVIAEKINNT